MKVTLYNAVSIDGYIAGKNDDTDWVSDVDWKYFTKLCVDTGLVVYGARTYFDVGLKYNTLPIDGVLNVVMSSKTGDPVNGVEYYPKGPHDFVSEFSSRGYEKVVLAGGGKMNTSFLTVGLIDEIILTIHPIVLGEGVKLFSGLKTHYSCSLINQENVGDGLVRVHYRVE